METNKPFRIGKDLQFFNHFIFKSGENHVKLGWGLPDHSEILFQYMGDGTLFKLAMMVDAIRRQRPQGRLDLIIPYFPGARQDRVCNPGEALSVKVYADFINNLKFDRVRVFDPHSDVVAALVDRIEVVKNHEFIRKAIDKHPTNYVLVSPDAGANKKVFDLAKVLGGPRVIRADKIRDVTTGNIVDTEVFADDLTGQHCIIVDDIIAGGRTFKELAKKLKEKNAARVDLIVSHHEGTADQASLKESGIDHITTTDSLPAACVAASDFTTILEIDKFFV